MMKNTRKNKRYATITALPTLAIAMLSGCASTTPIQARATHYDMQLTIEPTSHSLHAKTAITVECATNSTLAIHDTRPLRLRLHPSLRITNAAFNGTDVRTKPVEPEQESDESSTTQYDVIVPANAKKGTLVLSTTGQIKQDVNEGEKEGQIHNFAMRAHIGPEGIYLNGLAWYPQLVTHADTEPVGRTYTVTADRIQGMPLVASADEDAHTMTSTGKHAWQTSYPIDHFTLVGGKHEVHRRTHNDVEIALHLKPEQSMHVEGLFNTAATILDRYEPLVGKYPARQFRIVDNFFSSGFAFPTFTLLSSQVINMGKRSQTGHGYIDHEMLHCWWGNGVLVDPRDGNWCESITSYATNYYGYVLDGNPTEARRKRRNYAHFLSRMSDDNNKPLSTYGKTNGCSRGVAYNKGAAVFHMLANKMGTEQFFKAMRNMNEEYLGKYANWSTIQDTCEKQHGQSLSKFFSDWIHGSHAPELTIENAVYDSASQTVQVTISQGKTSFDLDITLRVHFGQQFRDVPVNITDPTATVSIPFSPVPSGIEIDPDYDIFRKVSESDIIPTTNTTRAGKYLITLQPANNDFEKYSQVRSIFEEKLDEENCAAIPVEILSTNDLHGKSVLALGSTALFPWITEQLAFIDGAPTFTTEGFEFQGVQYNDPKYAVLCTFVPKGLEKGGVTIVHGNSEAALPKPYYIPFYDRSLVIFENGRAIIRHDFEPRHITPVTVQ